MSSYTMQLREYIEQFSQYKRGMSINDKIKHGRKYLFDFDYPFFDEEYRSTFEENIIREFYMREIGFETEELFKFKLENWLRINMPYFNELFESEKVDFDILVNTDVRIKRDNIKDRDTEKDREDKRSERGTSSSSGRDTTDSSSELESEVDNFNRKIVSDTPDTRVNLTTNNDGTGILRYASEITETSNKENQNQTSSTNSTSNITNEGSMTGNEDYTRDEKEKQKEVEDFKEHRKGKIGQQSYASMLKEYRDSLLRIENMIHRELQQLFMLVY